MRRKSLSTGQGAGQDALASLGLSDVDCDALAQQGFVSAEYRQDGSHVYGPFFKLRWRCNGRQRLRYLGRDAERAARVREALVKLQSSRQLTKEALKLCAAARKQLHDVRESLRPRLAQCAVHFHGYVVRKSRPV